MMHEPTLPQSLTHAAASARIAELRRDAERVRLARTVRRVGRPRTPWPAVVVAALRDSLTGTPTRRMPAPAPDRSGAVCCA